MIELRPKTLRIAWLIISAVLVASASMLHQPLDRLSRTYGLSPSGNAALAKHPELALLGVAPGGLKSMMINYFWIRSQTLHREGRHFDAMQMAELICSLQPRFPSVWQFQSWQLAWNISATTHTGPERWHWVKRGIDLLRDQGIAMNPNSLLLYKQLAWTFVSKMNDITDDMHWYYKRKWAQEMQRLLGAQPLATTEEVRAAFKLIADAPLDDDPYRPRGAEIQDDQREKLVDANPDVAALERDLLGVGLKIDATLLSAYNYCTLDEAIEITRREPVEDRDLRLRNTAKAIKDPTEKAKQLEQLDRKKNWAKVINDPVHSKAMVKTLAFLRAQGLWGIHKMDPDYMYEMMKKLGPIDWRLVGSHGLYWSMYGVEHCKDVPKEHIDRLNTDRSVLTSLKRMAWQGKMDYFSAIRVLGTEEGLPDIRFRADWRFIESAHQQYLSLGTKYAKIRGQKFEKNPLNTGHINFLGDALAALYIRGKRQEAQKYYHWVQTNYKKTDDEVWGAEHLDGTVIAKFIDEGNLIPRVTTAQLTASLQMAMVWLASGDTAAFKGNVNYAQRLHRAYHTSEASKSTRLALPPLEATAANVFGELLLRPRLLDFDLSLTQRSVMYAAMEQQWPIVVAYVYDLVQRRLRRQCLKENMDFDKLFPPPKDIDTIRRYRMNQSRRQQ
jgi:hypothetical protein